MAKYGPHNRLGLEEVARLRRRELLAAIDLPTEPEQVGGRLSGCYCLAFVAGYD